MSLRRSKSSSEPIFIDMTKDSNMDDFEEGGVQDEICFKENNYRLSRKTPIQDTKGRKSMIKGKKDGENDGYKVQLNKSSKKIAKKTIEKKGICKSKNQAMECENGESVGKIRARAPPLLMYNVMKALTDEQKKSLRDIGFGCMEKFDISDIPTTLGLKVVENFDHVSCSMNIDGEQMEITRHTIHDVLGVPMGDRKINALKAARMRDVVTSEWRQQFPVNKKRIYPNNVSDKMVYQKKGGKMFQLNFLVLFVTIMAEVIKCGTVNQKFLPCITNINEIKDMDWCGYILDCLKRTKAEWKRGTHHNGPLVFLVLFYAQAMKGSSNPEDDHFIPVINLWSSDDLLKLENEENCEVAKEVFNEVSVRDVEIENIEDDDLTLNQLCQTSSEIKSSKRKSANDGNGMNKKANNDNRMNKKANSFHYKVSNIKDKGYVGNEADDSNPYSTQNLIEDLGTPNVQIGIEGLYSVFEGGAVSYGRAQQPKSLKEYKNVVELNLCMISDLIVETNDTIDQAIRDYPEYVEFKKLKEVMHKKFNADVVEFDGRTEKTEREKKEENEVVNYLDEEILLKDTQFFDSPTVMKTIESLEKSACELVRLKLPFSIDVDKNTRRLSFEAPTFDLGISQMTFKEVGANVEENIHDKEHGSLLGYSAGLQSNTKKTNIKFQTKNDAEPEICMKGEQFKTPEGQSARIQIASVVSGLQGSEKVKPLASGTHGSKTTLNKKNERSECEGLVQMVFDAVPLSSVKPEIKQKYSMRETKLPHIMLSPYVTRDVCIYGNVSAVEKRISESIFSATQPEEDIIFKTNSVECQRAIIESLMPGITIVSGAIDVWCLVLNYEERLRNPDKVSRLFCNTSMVTQAMLIKDDVSEKMYDIFFENMKNVLNQSVFKSIDDIDLVFFPIMHVNHYYVMCYNLMTGKLDIIDNMVSAEMDLVKRYGKLPIVLTSLFASYLSSMNHPQARKLTNPITKVLKMSWQTKVNFVDCGVFVMRHMEMYKGDGTIGGFTTGFVKEGRDQKKQLDELRVKYLSKMLLCDLNMKKGKVIDECESYQKLPRFEKTKLKAEAADRIEGRLSRMIKSVNE